MKHKDPIYEGILQDINITYTITEIQVLCMIERCDIEEMVAQGILEPEGATYETWIFSYTALSRTQKALRLHRDLAINWPGVALALDLLEELQELRETIATLEQHS